MFNIDSGAVSCTSKKQDVVGLSTTETEYISLSIASSSSTLVDKGTTRTEVFSRSGDNHVLW